MYYSLLVGAKIAIVIPRRLGHRIFGSLGFLFGLLPTKINNNLIRIHGLISPNASSKQLKERSAKVLSQYSKYWWDVFWLSSTRSKSTIDKIVDTEGFEKIQAILENLKRENKGAIFVLPHIGSWEIAGAWVANQGYQPLVVAERLKPAELFELFTQTRSRVGMEVIPHDDKPSEKLLAGLNQGRIICLVSDRDMSRKGLEVDFFGKMKSFPAGPAVLSKKANVPIIPVCTYLSHNGKITLTFGDEIETDNSHSVEEITQKMVRVFEEMILRDPQQWHVLQYEWSDQ